ncbi:MAG TPA: GNAT family N-acetyltransferase [Solirubrobacteraceae bacterium]|nr:GNAT family N-acetyltransferase [Solirubrobacteraceae bacterium]
MTAASSTTTQVTLREARVDDVEACAQICFEAFGAIHDHHRFPRDFPALEATMGLLQAFVPHPEIWGVVAEMDGRVVGSNFLDERDPIRGVGPITIAPAAQNAGVGRRLMEAVIERGGDAPGIRLLQDAFHLRSLSLYSSLGFDVTDPCVVMTGTPRGAPADGVNVRPVTDDDLEACGELATRVHGFPRNGALRDAIQAMAPLLAERDGEVIAYATSSTFWPMGHGVALTEQDMSALLLGAAAIVDEPLALLVPMRTGLFRWCLEQGLRSVKPMNVMVRGEYREPDGGWFPSVLY